MRRRTFLKEIGCAADVSLLAKDAWTDMIAGLEQQIPRLLKEGFMYSGEGYSYLQSVVTSLIEQIDDKDCATYEAGMKVCGTDVDDFMKK